jgi:aldehyde dehydrogenase (NAD+)
MFGLAASVWSENIGLALETAVSLKAGAMWVNCHNIFDAAAGFGGYKESGYGREGGEEGLYAYLKPKWQAGRPAPNVTAAMKANAKWGSADADQSLPGARGGRGQGLVSSSSSFSAGEVDIDRTPKMYVGGKQARPDRAYSVPVYSHDGSRLLGQVGDGNRKDIRNAVEAAHSAAGGWGKRAAHDRAQICFYIAENLNIRKREFSSTLQAMTGRDQASCDDEVEESISRLFTYAAWADKYGGNVKETPLYGLCASLHEPVGVIGIACPTEFPLLGFISLVAPAIIRGNTIVAVPSEAAPLAATDLYQVLDTSDLPGGVVNIVTGSRDHLAKTLVEHQHVDSMWYFGSAEGSYHVEALSAGNMKRVFCGYGGARDWMDPDQGEGKEFLIEATEVKNVWVPIGEQM